MNKDVVLEIAQSCASLTHGRHELILSNDNVFSIYIRLFDDSSVFETWALNDNVLANNNHNIRALVRSKYSFDKESTQLQNGCAFVEKISSLYSIPFVTMDASNNLLNVKWNSSEPVPHIMPIVCIFFNEQNNQTRFIYYKKPGKFKKLGFYSLFPHYAPNPSSMTYKFIIAQLLALFKECHLKKFYPLFNSDSILIDEHQWIWFRLDDALKNVTHTTFENEKLFLSTAPPVESDLKKATTKWCSRQMSNYEYLMLLNKYAGRKYGDLTCHPVLPWVSDFTSPNSNFRPLDRTKYRLAKGDAQLLEQYSKQTPSYHVPELLSDICYMVYRARIESKENLLKHVRAQWVPEEYPTSMTRLYLWTPDECIPEFFNDPNIFKSKHSDMADLQLPAWTQSPEEFVEWHRKLLESDDVSEKLHHWIDLTFGYLLTGKAAVNALNVHLSFTEHVQNENIVGPVQLFNTPHPQRCLENFDIYSNPLHKDTVVESRLNVFGSKSGLVELYQTILTLTNSDSPAAYQSCQSLAIIIIELILPQSFRDIAANNFALKLTRAQHVLNQRLGGIPSYLRIPLKQILLENVEKNKISIDTIVDDCNNFFNLPNMMSTIHENLIHFFNVDTMILINSFSIDNIDFNYNTKVEILQDCVQFSSMGTIWLDLFIELLYNRRIAAKVCYALLTPFSRNYDREEISKILIPFCNILDIQTSNLILLIDTQFLVNCSMTFGSQVFLDSVVPKFLEIVVIARDNLYEAVREIILWIARRYGPNLTAKYITAPLLCLLPTCYNDADQRHVTGSPDSLTYEVSGDASFKNLSKCLIEVAIMFGAPFINVQYLPFCADVFEQAHGRTVILASWESAMVASVVFLKKLVECLTDQNLMDQLEDVVVGKILFSAIKLITSTSFTFSTADGRKLLAYKTMCTLHCIANRLGADNVERYMAFTIQKLFSTFSILYELDADGELQDLNSQHSELSSIFKPNFALLLVHLFSFTCGRQYTFSIIQNKALINKLEAAAKFTPILPQLDTRLLYTADVKQIASSPSPISNNLSRSLPSGNRISTFYVADSSNTPPTTTSIDETFVNDSLTLCQRVNDDNLTHLQGTWIDHFRGILTAFSPFVPFDQIQLCSFNGHNSAVKKIYVLENENSFISASSDKTVKLWSLKNFNEFCSSQMSYERHSKAVVDVLMLESEGKILSTDGTVHIWDPFCDKTLQKVTWQDNGVDVNVNCIAQQNSSTVMLSSPASSFVTTYDTRGFKFANRYAVLPPSEISHGVRTTSVSPNRNYVATGLASGNISVIDVRTCRIISFVHVSESEIVQLEWLSNEVLVVVNTDHTSMIYELTNKIRQFNCFKEPITGIYAVNDREYLTFHPLNRIRFYIDGEFRTETKLHSDILGSSTISVLSFLRLNQMFLLGSNTGSFRLIC